MTAVAVAIEVYQITESSLSVGLLGLFAVVPLVGFGLYGGAVADSMDRRTLALLASCGLWAVSLVLATQAFLGYESVSLLYACTSAQSACYALNNPARNAMIPRLLPIELLPSASALNSASFNLGMTVGPVTGALLIHWGGFQAAYSFDVVTFTAALYALFRLPRMPPIGGGRRPGIRAVLDGIQYLRVAPNLRMTFVLDLCAMVFAHPAALFPALAYKVFGGTASAVGILQAAPALGALIAFVFSGWLSRVRLQGLAIVVTILIYGLAIGSLGFASSLWLAVAMLAVAGMADMVSAAYRSTILQVAAPDELRGRIQGVFIVVVAGGPRLGDFFAGAMGDALGERTALLVGGTVSILAVLAVVFRQRDFLRYNADAPKP